jgi:hypothetical protein
MAIAIVAKRHADAAGRMCLAIESDQAAGLSRRLRREPGRVLSDRSATAAIRDHPCLFRPTQGTTRVAGVRRGGRTGEIVTWRVPEQPGLDRPPGKL